MIEFISDPPAGRYPEGGYETEGHGLPVDLLGETSPRVMAEMDAPPSDPERYRRLDTRLLCEAVRRHAAQAMQEPPRLPPALDHIERTDALQLLRLWHTNWNAPRPRQANRDERHGRVSAICGLEPLHRHLLRDAPAQGGEEGAEYGDEVFLEGSEIHHSEPQERPAAHAPRLFDLCAEGAGLVEEEDCGLQVGQIVLLLPDHPMEHLRPGTTGVIRHRRKRGLRHYEIGLQFLEGRPHPLEIKPLIAGAGDSGDFTPALLVEGEGTPPHLLVPKGLFKPKRAFVLRHGAQQRRVRATALLETTPFIDRFTFGL